MGLSRARATRVRAIHRSAALTSEDDVRRRRRPGASPGLGSVIGNRAVSRIVQSGSAQTIQRYSFENTDWKNTNGVERSGDGAKGVVFFIDGSPNPLVTKASADPPRETLFATLLYNKLGNKQQVSAPPTRLASPQERNEIADQIAEKAMWKPAERDDDVAAFRQGEPHVWVMGRARGKTFGSARKKGEGWTKSPLGGARVIELLENPDYARRMGFVTCLDLFLGNGDRIDAPNLGNWMTDEQGAIALIDNFSSESLQSLTERAQGSWESSFMPDLKPSKFLEKGARVYDQLFNNAPPEVKQAMGKSLGVSPEGRKKLFAKHFAKGMADGRAAILAKLAPMFGKRSRSLKETVVSGEGGQQAWALVKRRVRLFKNLK